MPEADEGSEGSSVDIPCRCPAGEWISGPRTSQNSSLPLNLLEFDYSFGYDSKKLFNLCLIDFNTLVFASGNILNFFNIKTKEMTFRRSALGGGIGCIIKNPNPKYNYLTVAENGIKPPIIIYSFPGMEIVHVLNEGAKRSFNHMDYNRTGELLASQAGDPDYMLTIWDWQQKQIILRAKSFQNDVLNVMFSPYNPSQLTTCGLGHIKFWKMSRTFTGLKLQGELGRFGKTEICDIYALYPLPDEKVISGCEWGNMLVWDAGLIKVEVCRKNRKPCHTAPITQISMMEGEVMTVGMDGYIRIWFWETVDLADPPEDDRFVEIEPIYEFRIGSKSHICELRHLIKKEPEEARDYTFYAQDGVGGIWMCDLNPEQTPTPPEQLYVSHEGAIKAIVASPTSKHIASLGEGGRLHLYNYKTRKLLATKQFPAGGRDMIWISPMIEPTGLVAIAAFDDGVIRTVLLETNEQKAMQQGILLIDVQKAHSKAITTISINPKQTVLASASEDSTVFIYQLRPSSPFISIIPIGFVTVASIPTAIAWRPMRPATILIGCLYGHVAEIDVPDKPRTYTEFSFSLNHIQRKEFQFVSVKSEIRRQNQIDAMNRRKERKVERKLKELKEIQAADPSIEKDMDVYLADSDPEEELLPLFYPKVPNQILWMHYTSDNTIWLLLSGYDAGYIYEYVFEGLEGHLVKTTLIADAEDVEIHVAHRLQSYQIFGMQDGSIRVILEKSDFHDLSDYWELTMHDNFNGKINAICTSFDYRNIFSVGNDGNLFSYHWNGPTETFNVPQTVKYMTPQIVNDIDDKQALSLEEEKLKLVSDKQTEQANERKAKTLDILSEYKLIFKEIWKRNRALPVSQQFTHDELELDARVTVDILNGLNEQLQLVRRKMAFEVEKVTLARTKVMKHFIDPLDHLQVTIAAIRSTNSVRSFRMEKLDDDFYRIKDEVEQMIQERKEKKWDIQYFSPELEHEIQTQSQSAESFLQGLSVSAIDLKLDTKMKRLLEKYRFRKAQEHSRDLERSSIEAERPDPNQNHPDDVRAIEEAEKSIGDYKLKTDPNYEPDESQNTLQKYKEIISTREELYHLRNAFNTKFFELRKCKKDLYTYIGRKQTELNDLHRRLPEKMRKYFIVPPEIDVEKEYPEESLKVTTQSGTGAEIRNILSRKSQIFRSSLALKTEKKQEDRYAQIILEIFSYSSKLTNITFEDVCAAVDSVRLIDDDQNSVENITDTSSLAAIPKEFLFTIILKTLAEQDYITQDVDFRINEFDKKLEELSEERLRIDTDATFLDLFLLTLNQELYILRDFERLEDDLVEQVEESVQKRNEVQTNIIRVKNAIEEHRRAIERMIEQEKTIQNQFLSNVKSNKFAEFLRKIFKKKYKPPKETAANESEESNESSDSPSSGEEDDTKSMDSLELQPMRFDEKFCPPGCDRQLYDLTFELRAERHILEQKVFGEHKSIDAAKKQTEELNSKMKEIELQLTANRSTLMEFRREKQRYLNTVETLIVLKMDQMQYLKDGGNIYDIDNTLLFNMPSVTSLYTRVGQLYVETEEAKQKHRINIVHLGRMKTDCRYMEHRINRLKSDIEQLMIKKFGRVVDLDELEESVLRRCVFNLRSNIEDEKKEAEKKVAELKEQFYNIEQEIIRETQIGTEKINILTVLQEEKNYLHQVLQRQNKMLVKLATKAEKQIDFRHDLKKLKDIEKQQEEQIEYLEKEIRGLRLKAKTFLCPDEQKTELPAYSEVLPPHDDLCYEEYVYTAVRELTQGKEMSYVSPEVDVFEKVNILVEKFIMKVLDGQIEAETLRKCSMKIAKQMAYVANNLDETQSMKSIKCIIKFVYATIPKQHHQYLMESDLETLFRKVVAIVHDQNSVINIADIMSSIISNAQETVRHMHVLNVTQELVTEIFKAMVEVLSVAEISSGAVIQQIAAALSKMDKVDPRCVNFTLLAENAIQHARDNMNDDITLNVVRHFTDMLVNAITPKH